MNNVVEMYLQNAIELGSEHHVALRLELAAHERLLAIELALRQLLEGLVGHHDGDVGLALGLALVNRASGLEVDRPYALLARRVLNAELEDAVGLLRISISVCWAGSEKLEVGECIWRVESGGRGP